MDSIKAIALYLPQFHPIPENDEWWGKGFTEWTNVTKAKPLFPGHWQPRLPADLGYYDLRVAESRAAQAALAKQYGVYGFCYWHYWFAGKRVIERPFAEVVGSGEPDFPFCLSWANQTWSGTWHGLSSNKVLIEQTYPGEEDYTNHFYALLDAFRDKRYISINGKKIFFVFRPNELPDPSAFIDCWQKLAVKEGIGTMHFVGMHMEPDWEYRQFGFDAIVEMGPRLHELAKPGLLDKIVHRMSGETLTEKIRRRKNTPRVYAYQKYVDAYPQHQLAEHEYPMIYPSWDNTPRSKSNGWLFEKSTPELFGKLCQKAFQLTKNKPTGEKIVMLKSWNEWAEGNYLEPDQVFGAQYLQQFKKALDTYQ